MQQRGEPFLMIIIGMVFILSLLYIISYANMGVGIRMRDQMMPLILIFASLQFAEIALKRLKKLNDD